MTGVRAAPIPDQGTGLWADHIGSGIGERDSAYPVHKACFYKVKMIQREVFTVINISLYKRKITALLYLHPFF